MQRSNLERLIATAELVRPLLPDLVFVGGAVTSLLITDDGAGAPRPTLDVDAIAAITSYAEYAAFGERLRALGFSEDMIDGAPVCRWVQQDLVLDIMPLDEKILGFSNRWYRAAMDAALAQELPGGLRIRVVTAPFFLATKIEAFRGRGKGDFAVSHDLEDLIFVIDGHASIADDVRSQGAPLRDYLRAEFRDLLGTPAFVDALPGYLMPDPASQARLALILRRMEALAT